MKHLVQDLYVDVYPELVVVRETRARTDFSFARNTAITLLSIHDQQTGGGTGRPPPELEALKRSALILTVTAWESFVEDTVTQQLERKLEGANKPSDLQSIFNHVAEEWLDPSRSSVRHGPDLSDWAGDGWKQLIRSSLAKTLETFHTPNSENTERLFKQYLHKPIRQHWSWQGMSANTAQRRLNELIKLRGQVVHRGKTMHPHSLHLPDIKKPAVIRALNLVYNLVYTTEIALGIEPNV